MLVPRDAPGVTAKVLGGAAADVVRRLGEGEALPDALDEVALARLVLDGALEVEDGGRFVSGPRAHAAVFEGARRDEGGGRVAELSRRAVRYAQDLPVDDVHVLSRRMYAYGAIPRGPRWDRVAGPADDTSGLLGLGAGGPAQRALAAEYEGAVHPHWLSWARRGAEAEEPPYKLYVSPRPELLARCFPAIAEVLAAHDVTSFKVGRGVLGLLRPDKVVVYLDDRDALERVAASLAGALGDCPAHGVPFSAELAGDGLLSWGMDPPARERLLDARPQESWRLWVTNRLAGAIVFARAAGCDVEPWEYAVDRLALEGVDPVTWLPADSIWAVS